MNKKAVYYVRVSTEDQAAHGNGLNLQRIAIERYANEKGYTLVGTFQDIYTAVGPDSLSARPGVQDAIRKARKENAVIIVNGIDRFTRDPPTLEKYLSGGNPQLVSTGDDVRPAKAASIAGAERAQAQAKRISETTKEGLRRKKELGASLGNPTNLPAAQKLGAEANRSKANDRIKQLRPIIHQIKADGPKSVAAIAATLNGMGLRTPTGLEWNAGSLIRSLKAIEDLERRERNLKNPKWGIYG